MDSFSEDRPVPIIDHALCDGCGLCVRACPSHALALADGKAIVARPDACQYDGYCEMICPVQAITRPFLIITVPQEQTHDEIAQQMKSNIRNSTFMS